MCCRKKELNPLYKVWNLKRLPFSHQLKKELDGYNSPAQRSGQNLSPSPRSWGGRVVSHEKEKSQSCSIHMSRFRVYTIHIIKGTPKSRNYLNCFSTVKSLGPLIYYKQLQKLSVEIFPSSRANRQIRKKGREREMERTWIWTQKVTNYKDHEERTVMKNCLL